MKSLSHIGLILAILGASSICAQNTDDDSALKSQTPPSSSSSSSSSSSRIMRRTSSGALISVAQSDIVINDRQRMTITVLGEEIINERVNVPGGVSSAYFTRFNRARCFFHSVYKDDDNNNNNNDDEETRNEQFITPVFPSLDLDDAAVTGFGDTLRELSQLRLPPDQTPFMADQLFCFYPQPQRTQRTRQQQQAVVLVEYDDRTTEALRVNLRSSSSSSNNNNVVPLNTGRFRDATTFFGRVRSSLFESGYDYRASVRRAAIITASDRQRTRCFFAFDEGEQAQQQQQQQQQQQVFTWQSPLLAPVEGPIGIVCEQVNG